VNPTEALAKVESHRTFQTGCKNIEIAPKSEMKTKKERVVETTRV